MQSHSSWSRAKPGAAGAAGGLSLGKALAAVPLRRHLNHKHGNHRSTARFAYYGPIILGRASMRNTVRRVFEFSLVALGFISAVILLYGIGSMLLG